MKKTALIASVAVLSVCAAVVVVSQRGETAAIGPQPQTAKSPQTQPWRCVPPVGARVSWAVRIENRYFIDPKPLVGRNTAPAATNGKRLFTATMTMRVIASQGAGHRVELAMHDAKTQQTGDKNEAHAGAAMALPVQAVVGPRCALELAALSDDAGENNKVVHNKRAPNKAAEQWRLILDVLAVKAPVDAAATTWQQEHVDGGGTYIAAYTRDVDDPTVVYRRRLRYSRVTAPGPTGSTAEIGVSELRIETRPDGGVAGWVGTEELTFKTAKGETFARNKAVVSVTQNDAKPASRVNPPQTQ